MPPHTRPVTRRDALRTGLAVAAALAARPAAPVPVASAQRMVQGTNVRFSFVASDGASIYAVRDTGELLWFRHGDTPATRATWDPGSGQQVGEGWTGLRHLVTAGPGVLLAITTTGDMMRVVDDRGDGTATGLDLEAAALAGTGWDRYVHVAPGRDGALYGITRDGTLDHHAAPGDATAGTRLGGGWAGYRAILGTGDGSLHAIAPDGTLTRHDIAAGSSVPDPAAGTALGHDWHQFTHAFAGGPGTLYGVAVGELYGRLLRFQDDTTAGTDLNAAAGEEIGQGWQVSNLEGYCWPDSADPGTVITVSLSSLDPEVTVTPVRLVDAPSGDHAAPAGDPFPVTAQFQPALRGAWSRGCGWEPTFTLEIPADWPSGLYAVRCEALGQRCDIPFVVRSAPAARQDLLVLANTNTWCAYNTWGGESNYTVGGVKQLSLLRPNPHLLTAAQDHSQGSHMLRSEIWFATWLAEAGYGFDVCTDGDLDAGVDLGAYRALILSTHPEYWSVAMREQVVAYLQSGGSLLYLGGNGMYRVVDMVPDGTSFYTGLGAGELFREAGIPERQVFGVAYEDDTASPSTYTVVDAAHPIFAGTGLSEGDAFGAEGRNGAASRWETDVIASHWPEPAPGDEAPPDTHVLANRTAGQEGSMVIRELDSGGIVFSAGSITFVGSLVVDPVLDRIVRNALDLALGRPVEAG